MHDSLLDSPCAKLHLKLGLFVSITKITQTCKKSAVEMSQITELPLYGLSVVLNYQDIYSTHYLLYLIFFVIL